MSVLMFICLSDSVLAKPVLLFWFVYCWRGSVLRQLFTEAQSKAMWCYITLRYTQREVVPTTLTLMCTKDLQVKWS